MTPRYTVRYTRDAQRAFRRIAMTLIDWGASPAVARAWVSDLYAACEKLGDLPHQGTMRDDIRPTLRTVGFRRRATIVFNVFDDRREVEVIGIFYAGQDWSGVS